MKLKKSANILSIIFAATFLVSCGSSDDSTEVDGLPTYIVNVESTPHYFGVDSDINIDAVAQVQNGTDTVASDIYGFEYEFGTSYELRVWQLEIAASDSSSGISTELVEVISATPDAIGTSYVYNEVTLEGNPFTANEQTAGVYAFYQYEFLCAENVDCDGLVAIADSGGLVSVEFEYTGGEVPITLVWWN
ncbi:hypothetical protein EGC76_06010 [Pseudidiomarina gelatinasegens]|uniref:DUF4377 domain-containing protein n=1 Tax=Pseudidiomarina gelatinasegens TaxID=2487740 RepID=A0A451GDV7_9GAMM|nr:hypothetical protein [Pseudidiomarina gelatinasegens]RWU11100.1 hypothetical protein EGC76_06010 [Pseudidiomarina gelatinasegens]